MIWLLRAGFWERKEQAAILGVSYSAIRVHWNRIYLKAGITNRYNKHIRLLWLINRGQIIIPSGPFEKH